MATKQDKNRSGKSIDATTTAQVAVEMKLWNKRGGAKQGAGFYASSKSRGFFLLISGPQK
jgi:hypothetical protein